MGEHSVIIVGCELNLLSKNSCKNCAVFPPLLVWSFIGSELLTPCPLIRKIGDPRSGTPHLPRRGNVIPLQ